MEPYHIRHIIETLPAYGIEVPVMIDENSATIALIKNAVRDGILEALEILEENEKKKGEQK